MQLLQQLIFSASITGPIALVLLLGMLLKRVQLIDDHFIEVASKLVFRITLPTLLFISIVGSEHDFMATAPMLIFGIIANIFAFILCIGLTKAVFSKDAEKHADFGVIIQGGFRANTGVIGLALVINTYSETSVAWAAIYVAAITLLYNIQAVIILTPASKHQSMWVNCIDISKSMLKNPLIISILLGLLCDTFSLPLPQLLIHVGDYFADMTLPLALICIGGALNLKAFKQDTSATLFASLLRLLICPLLITTAAIFCGFRQLELGIIFFMSAAPTATVSYVMVRALNGNAALAANIIALTTLFCLLTSTLGAFILASLQLL